MAAEPQPESEPATPHQLVSGPSVAWLAEIDAATAGSDDVDVVYKEGGLSKSKKKSQRCKQEKTAQFGNGSLGASTQRSLAIRSWQTENVISPNETHIDSKSTLTALTSKPATNIG